MTNSAIDGKLQYEHIHCPGARSGSERLYSYHLEETSLMTTVSIEDKMRLIHIESITSPSRRSGTGQSFTISRTSGGPVFFTTTARMLPRCRFYIFQENYMIRAVQEPVLDCRLSFSTSPVWDMRQLDLSTCLPAELSKQQEKRSSEQTALVFMTALQMRQPLCASSLP